MKRNGRSKCLNCGRNGKHEVLVMKDGFMRSKKTVLIKVTSLIVSFILSIFFDCTEIQIKTVLSRYNGTNEQAVEYGNACYDYFLIFEAING